MTSSPAEPERSAALAAIGVLDLTRILTGLSSAPHRHGRETHIEAGRPPCKIEALYADGAVR